MSYNWFEDVLDVLGEVVNFKAIVNYAGNAFVEKSWDMILDSNPMLKGTIPSAAERQLANFFDTAQVTIIKSSGDAKGDKGNGNEDESGQRNEGHECAGAGNPG